MSASEIDEYRPSEDEPFMGERQKEYFRKKLLAWKQDILKESQGTLTNLQEEENHLPDIADRASSETEKALELRTRDRQRKLISEPIGVRRLDARPIATLSLEAQERHEREEKVYRDD